MSNKIAAWEDKGNKHINLDGERRPLPYHEIISDLVIQHSMDGDSVLDIGCGVGHLCEEINNKGNRVLHIADAYQVCLDRTSARTKVERTYLIDETDFNIAEAIKGEFSVVVMSHVLEHMLNPVQAVRDAMAFVKPGGYLIMAVPNPARPGVLISNLTKTHYVNRGHVVAWDMSHWINFLENVMELDVVSYHHDYIQIKGCNSLPIIMSLGKMIGKIIPWWCFSNIAVIKKS